LVNTVREALWQRAMLPTDRFRRRRMTAFVAEFGAGPRQTVLDVGGRPPPAASRSSRTT
jgi:hypothetical protein